MALSVLSRLPQSWLQPSGKYDRPTWILMSLLSGFIGIAFYGVLIRKHSERPRRVRPQDAVSTDPGLLKKGTTYEHYTTPSGHSYPRIRTFYSVHPQAKKLPDDLPLFVFMHGLGGSVAQFAPLLTSLVNTAPCLAIDLPGCGLSDFKPAALDAYTTMAFAELLFSAIDRFRNKDIDQKVILIGHSMGCSISAILASTNSPLAHLCCDKILGFTAICPKSTTLSTHDLLSIQRLNYVPSAIFDLIRLTDRRGGIDSASVMRVVGKEADEETKKLQLRFNQQSRSPVFQKFLLALHLQETRTTSQGHDSLLGKRIWGGIRVPMFLVAAESDHLAPPREAEQIAEWLAEGPKNSHDQSYASSNESTDIETDGSTSKRPGEESESTLVPAVSGDAEMAVQQLVLNRSTTPSRPEGETDTVIKEEYTSTKHASALKISIFPAPASHGLLYATADVRVLSGLIENFLAKYVDQRLSPGWQLQHLTTSGKWDVKNLKKWQSIEPCSDAIGGVFRAMKTMREVDQGHCPSEFLKKFSWEVIPDGVAMVVDISHESPVYDKNGLEQGGVEYHKFPTVSKLPPTADEVEHFISLIDGLRRSHKFDVQVGSDHKPTIGVHCHYGFNRTGFFIVCYLVERLGFTLQDAVAEFARKRSPGIKHGYFVNELFVRYAVKMERRGTIVG